MKNRDKPDKVVARGINPAGFKRPNPRANQNRGPQTKRQRFNVSLLQEH